MPCACFAMFEHSFGAVYDASSLVLILGSFPSVKSREQGFYYAHPQNRFWRVMGGVTGEDVPDGKEARRVFLLRNRIALWDVLAACDVTGSSDASIRNAVPNDLSSLLNGSSVRKIFVNGRTAATLYDRFLLSQTGIPAVCLPSTSPANARCSLDRLTGIWKQEIRPFLLK